MGKAPGSFVVLGAGGGHIDFEAVGKNDDRGLEFLKDPDPGIWRPFSIAPGKSDGIAFDNDIDVKIFMPQKHIPDKAADDVGIVTQLIRHQTHLLEDVE